jgi:hypothetical protein
MMGLRQFQNVINFMEVGIIATFVTWIVVQLSTLLYGCLEELCTQNFYALEVLARRKISFGAFTLSSTSQSACMLLWISSTFSIVFSFYSCVKIKCESIKSPCFTCHHHNANKKKSQSLLLHRKTSHFFWTPPLLDIYARQNFMYSYRMIWVTDLSQ